MDRVLKDVFQEGKDLLNKAGIVSYQLDAELLLGHCLQKSRTQLILDSDHPVSHSKYQIFKKMLKRRLRSEPIAYIIGEREFWSLPFTVNRHVLIPRPETEFLLEKVFSEVSGSSKEIVNCADLCCGSGVIAVVLALELHVPVTALDISDKALEVARENIVRHGVEKLVVTVSSDLYSRLSREKKFDLIVTNPPYVSKRDIEQNIDLEVSGYEPKLALDGGEDGLEIIRKIAHESLNRLTPEALFLMEFGADQGEEIKSIFCNQSLGDKRYESVQIFKDYSERDRVLLAKVNKYKE